MMSNKDSEKKESAAATSASVGEQSQSLECATLKGVRKIPVGKPGPKCRKMLVDEPKLNKEDMLNASEEKTKKSEEAGDVPGELREMFGDLASSPEKKANPPSKVTTENLLSVLEDEADKKAEQELSSSASTKNDLPSSAGEPILNGSAENKSSEVPKISSKRYVYKLKSKSGKVLKYTSNTPIVLKKPVINLVKMADIDEGVNKGDETADHDVDSDNSTKENMKDNDASGDTTTAWTAKKRGRPPLSQKTCSTAAATASVVISSSSDDRNLSDVGDNNKSKMALSSPSSSSSSYGVQTRKRQLKFLPDGRLITPFKKGKTSLSTGAGDERKNNAETASSSDSDVQTASDDNENDSDYKNPSSAVKSKSSSEKKTPTVATVAAGMAEKKPTTAKKKVFDIENYIREKIGNSPLKEVREHHSATKSSVSVNQAQTPKNKSTITSSTSTSSSTNSQQISPSTPPPPQPPKKVTPVDPAQLLSSLIGVPITPSQLNIVKFKPKVIQERSSAAPTPKKVTIDDDKLKKMGINEQFRNTPFKVVSKTTFQKILPKPSPMTTPDRTPIMRRVEHRIIPATATPLTYATIAPKMTSDNVTSEPLSKFDNFTDSKVVKTKGGPKKVLKRKSVADGDDSPQTVYDLLQHVFDQMPSWNLHVIPDTNHFCIAQVSRGRMGIPILKKSIELNGDFFAKVYVHQLHCKRFDGVYDTESKILSLIREIDALAA